MIQCGGGPGLSVKPHQAIVIRRHFRGRNLSVISRPSLLSGGSIDFTH